MVIWLTPLLLNCPRGLWMTPVGKVEQLNQEKTPKQYFNNEKAQNNRLTTESFKVY